MLRVQIANTVKHSPPTRPFEAIVDSGATTCLFHADIGAAIGLKIESGTMKQVTGIEGSRPNVYLHNISLYIPGGHLLKIVAGFTPKLPVAGVLGMTGFFEHFKVTFDPATNELEIERIYRA